MESATVYAQVEVTAVHILIPHAWIVRGHALNADTIILRKQLNAPHVQMDLA